jgi:peptidoglycan LD-endopeptidase CwlK
LPERVFKDVPEDEVSTFIAICADAGGQSTVARQPNGLYNVTCTVAGSAGNMAAIEPTAQPAAPTLAPMTTPTSVAAAGAPVARAQPVEVHKHDSDLSKLHPSVRKAVEAVQKKLDAEKIPMRVFEAYRGPERQAHLYAQGRTRPGDKVTNAGPWGSYHQFGMAADFVRFENGKWNWNDKSPQERADWKRYHEIARENGLEPLSWELPHVQHDGVTLTELTNGQYPSGGDESWEENLAAVIARWPGAGAPPAPSGDERPAMPSLAVVTSDTESAGGLEWHSRFGGDAWAYDKKGVYTRDHTGQLKTWRTVGAPITVQEVLARYGDAIEKASAKHGVAPELIVMIIATETGIYRKHGFTGPETFRWEQGYTVNTTGDPALDGKQKGDYSAGPMQVMSDTARWINGLYGLGLDPATDLQFFKNKPTKAPTALGLYNGSICIDVGTAYLKHQLGTTKGNPLLLAAAYNAGGIYPSSGNRWRIKSHGNHLDRAAEWYGDACFVLNG